MADSPGKLKNIQSAGEPGNGLAPGVVEVEGSDGGAILDGGIPGAAKENIEGCGGYVENERRLIYDICREMFRSFHRKSPLMEYLHGRKGKRHLP